jgi:CarboxypepD_reg-like domain
MKLSLILIAIFALIPCLSQAQSLLGVVKDAKTNEPLPSANIFINNTTIGSVTDVDGKFRFSFNEQGGSYEIIISFVGYSTQSIKITPDGKDVNMGILQLRPLEIELGNVEIKSKRDKDWERKLKRFKKIFLGDDKLALACALKNPWALEFDDSNSVLGLRARTDVPLEIENNALGYRILFHLNDFWANKKAYSILGNAFFVELTTEDPKLKESWKSNRLKAYQHSTHHLFRSIITQQLTREGFSLYKEMKGFENPTFRSSTFYNELGKTISAYDTTTIAARDLKKGYYRINLKGRVEIHYNRERGIIPFYEDFVGPVSWLELKKDYIVVDENGYPRNPADLVVSGAMSLNRVSRMLPLDFKPEDRIESSFDLSFFKEQVYIHTDKPYYYPGETIWLKGYINYQWPAWRDSLSHTVYLELIDREKKEILVNKIVRVDSGFFNSDFFLPLSIEAKDYCLRAYTSLNRNFGDQELYIKQIPVLGWYEKPDWRDSSSVKFSSSENKPELFKILVDNKEYQQNGKITIFFKAKDDEDEPIEANFSISVTDVGKVAPIDLPTIVKEYPLREREGIQSFKRLQYAVERGISFSGRIRANTKSPISEMINVIQINRPNMTLTKSDKDGLFTVDGLIFYDTGKFIFNVAGRKTEDSIKIEIMDRKPAEIVFETNVHHFKRTQVDLPQRPFSEEDLFRDSKMLQNIEVKAKRIFVEKPIDRAQRAYGRPDYKLSRKDINASYGNLLQALPGKFPGLVVRQASNDGQDLRWVVYLAKAGDVGSFFNKREVLITINDVVIPGNPEQILSAIDPNTVESVELTTRVNVLYGALGGDGVLAIYTKKYEDVSASLKPKAITQAKVVGYSSPSRFEYLKGVSPRDPKIASDSQSTIYWNPEVKTDKFGYANLTLTPRQPGHYRVAVEGVNKKGQPFQSTTYFTVAH